MWYEFMVADELSEDLTRLLVILLGLRELCRVRAQEFPSLVRDAGKLVLRIVIDFVVLGDRPRDPRRLVEIMGGAVPITGFTGCDTPIRQRHREEPSIPGCRVATGVWTGKRP